MNVRLATSDDIGAVLQLWRAADAEPTHTDDVASLTRLLDHDPSALIVAVEDNRVVGSVIAAWDGWRGSIYRLVVRPEYRRQGVASRLLASAEARLRGVGAVRLQAIVVDTSVQATSFWRASGWVEQSERLRFVKG